jgi:hypothetical protein
MKARTLTTVAATVAFALMITFGSANRAQAHHGWGWGIGAGIATALILGAIYRHHRRHYCYGSPSYGYGYYGPVYRHYYAGAYRPRWNYHHRHYGQFYRHHRHW